MSNTFPDARLKHLEAAERVLKEMLRRLSAPPLGWFCRLHPEFRAIEERFLPAGRLSSKSWLGERVVRSGGKLEKIKTAIAPEFNAEFYLRVYPDIRLNDLDPLDLYIHFGWREGRDPRPDFCTRFYLETNPEVKVSGLNPFYHYLMYGRHEGRPTQESWEGDTVVGQNGMPLKFNPSARARVSDHLRSAALCRFEQLQPRSQFFDPQRLRIHWVMPDFHEGAGGHMTIFRMIHLLETVGHSNTIWINHPYRHIDGQQAHETILKHFQNVVADVRLISAELDVAEGDVIFATDASSVWPVLNAKYFKRRFYFVQDFEPLFHAWGAEALMAQETYWQDLDCICAGPWLESAMRERFGRWARKFWLAVDQDTYRTRTEPKPRTEHYHIAFYARHFVTRRATALGLLALEMLADRGVPMHVHFFGDSSGQTKETPYPATDHGVCSGEDLAELYHRADIGMVFSTTNYSLVPQEMMACGLPVLEINGESTRAVFPEGTVTLTGPHPKRIADDIEALLRDPVAREAQASAASDWVNDLTWHAQVEAVAGFIVERVEELGFRPEPKVAVGRSRPVASVVIPTLNGGEKFRSVMNVVLDQRTPWPFEILIIDSGSTDRTQEHVANLDNVRLLTIDGADFGHGKTRNLGVEETDGDFVALLTQDALPANPYWLYNIVALMRRFPTAGGAFGRHVAYPDASPFTKRDIDKHFRQFDALPVYIDNRSELFKANAWDPKWRQRFHYYSDNNSCLRRSVWQMVPYPDVEFGEDQLFAKNLLTSGFGKLYAKHAIVYHSHDYDETEMHARSKTEAAYFKEHFGYRTISTPKELRQQLKVLNVADEAWGMSRGLPRVEIERRKRLNKARLQGCLGAIECDKS